MVLLGITGGSGSGKTSVSDLFRKHGVFIIDADIVARDIVAVGTPALDEIVLEFGDTILQDDGSLNRKKLGNIVFSDPKKLATLNHITHRYITEEIKHILSKRNENIIGIDGAVLIESGIAKKCDYMCCVLADRNIRCDRIMHRDGLSMDNAYTRINAQPSDDFYIQNSNFVISNNSQIDLLERDVLEVLDKIRK